MEHNNLGNKSSVLSDEQYAEYQASLAEQQGPRAIAAFENGSPWKMYDSMEDCAKDFQLVNPFLIPCKYNGKDLVWFDTLPPVVKLIFVALDDIKNKPKSNA